MTNTFRVGMGYDVHRLVEGRRCIIGGIEFQSDVGLLGHSDADVLLHAICDALLGAANLGDIGDHFPDTDARWKNADSGMLLQHCVSLIQEKKYMINNLDTVIVCEKPKIKPQRAAMKKNIAKLLNVDEDCVSVKATTEEKMGFTGSGDGIAAWAYVSLIREDKAC